MTRTLLLAVSAVILIAAPGPAQLPPPKTLPLPTPVVPKSPVAPAPGPRTPPKLDPVAETKLLMEGIAQPNFDGLAKNLKDKPAEGAGWQFARGQALLIGETGNLLMLRPPKTKAGQDAWMARSADLRDAATGLARAAADKDLPNARAALSAVAGACNKCHETFRVEYRAKAGD